MQMFPSYYLSNSQTFLFLSTTMFLLQTWNSHCMFEDDKTAEYYLGVLDTTFLICYAVVSPADICGSNSPYVYS